MFNKSLFNRALFNRNASDNSSLYATISIGYDMQVAPLKALIKLPETSLSYRARIEFDNLGLLVPIPIVTMDASFNLSGSLYVFVPISWVVTGAEFFLSAGAVRTMESDKMTLEGLNLKPGQTVIIDTDTLDIEVDGEVRVDCWVTGGAFFQFKAGDNLLKFSDNSANRMLNVTVLWADRYL